MKKLSPYEQGNKLWSLMIKKLDDYMSHGILTNPSARLNLLSMYNITEEDYSRILSTAKYEVYCFAAYCAYVAGSKLFVKLIRGFDRQSWVEFIEGISEGMHEQIAALPNQEDDFILSPAEEADRVVIHYMQIFTKGDPRANIPWILALDKSTLKNSFEEFSENLEESVSMLTPNMEYPNSLMQWCPDAEYIYNCAAECADGK